MPKERKPPAKPSTKKKVTKGLTARQQLFVVEYLKDQNATAAYKRAGYAGEGRSAENAASRLLGSVGVRSTIDAKMAEILKKSEQETGITLQRVVREIAKVAFFDPRKMFREDGTPKHVTELDDDTAAAIAGLDVLEEYEGTGEDRRLIGHVKKYKVAEKKGHLDMLMKHLGGYEKDNGQKVSPLAEILAMVWGTGSPLPRKTD